MFDFLKKIRTIATSEKIVDDENSKEEMQKNNLKNVGGISINESIYKSTEEAKLKFEKPEKYNRKLYDSDAAKLSIKKNTFTNETEVKDPYTDSKLELRKSDAKLKYGEKWQEHLAEADHKTPIKKIFETNKSNPWLTNEDIHIIANKDKNLEIVSRKFNNAKRSKSNEEFVKDDEYLKKSGVNLSDQGKKNAIISGKVSEKAIKNDVSITSVKNVINTGHNSGRLAAENAGITVGTMSGITNIVAVIKGEKSAEDALQDTMVDTGKSATTGYLIGGGLTTLSHSLSSSSSKFIQALSASRVPKNIITAVMVTGKTINRYGNGEITTQECIIELGERGLCFATAGYSMVVGQTLIPIPIVGAAVGALVGSAATSTYYKELINTLKIKELEHQERLRIIAECEFAVAELKDYRLEIETYLKKYFIDHRECFDEALNEINFAFELGDADGIIKGANKITRKLGGKVHYDNIDEFKVFLSDDSVDIL